MPQVSKYPLSKQVYEKVTEIFLITVAKLNSKKQVDEFFGHLLSPTEKIMLSKRLAIAFLLAKDYDYRTISKLLRVSTSTIADIARHYKYDSKFKRYINRVIKEEQFEDFLLSLGDKLSSILASGKSKSGTWIYLRDEIKRKRKSKPF